MIKVEIFMIVDVCWKDFVWGWCMNCCLWLYVWLRFCKMIGIVDYSLNCVRDFLFFIDFFDLFIGFFRIC